MLCYLGMSEAKLRHLALILDGNHRWGKQRGIPMSVDFYIKSGLLGLDIAQAVFDRGIDKFTIWIGSVSNLTERPALELKALNKVYKKFFTDKENLDFLHERKIWVNCVGRWRELLEPDTVQAIQSTLDAVHKYHNSGKILTVLVGYDGREERGAALQKILSTIGDIYMSDDETAKSDFFDKELPQNLGGTKDTADTLRANSWTGYLPDVDLTIRTGAGKDPHNSAGFLSLLSDNTQYAFVETLWPDFTPEMLNDIVDDFENRERRMGK